MQLKIFYSWQSDTKAAANRSLIQSALENAAREIAADGSIGVEPVVDRDTTNVPGSPDIGATILSKIAASDVVVADVTIVNANEAGRRMPNPNVMLEVGYSLAVISDSRLILVQNTAFGGPELLPFDLRQKRVLQYASEENATQRADARRELQAAFRRAIELIVTQLGPRAADAAAIKLKLGYKADTSRGDMHEYRLRISVHNGGSARIEKWHADVVLPKLVIPKDQAKKAIHGQSNKERLLFRFDENSDGPFYPGDGKVLQVFYMMNDDLFENHSSILDEMVRVRCYANDQLVGTIERPFRELQQF